MYMAEKKKSIVGKIIKVIFAFVIFLIILLSIAVGIILFQTPKSLGLANKEINGTSIKELGLADTKVIDIIKQFKKLGNADEEKIVSNTYSDADKTNADKNFNNSDVTNYSDIITNLAMYDKNYYLEYNDTTLAYVYNECIKEGTSSSEIAFINEANATLMEITIDKDNNTLKLVLKADISGYKSDIEDKLGFAKNFVKIPSDAYLVCEYSMDVNNSGKLITETKSLAINGQDNALNNAILDIIINNIDSTKDKAYLADCIGQAFSDILANLGKIGKPSSYDSTTRVINGEVSYGTDSITNHKIGFVTYQPDDFHTHSWSKYQYDIDPTFESLGRLKRVCSLNSTHVEYYTLPRLNESDYVKSTIISTDCEVDGKYKYSTTVMGQLYTFDVTIPATGHKYSTEYTYNETQHWHQSTCSHNLKKDVDDHTLVQNGYDSVNGKIIYKCSLCNYEKKEDCIHEYISEIEKQATAHEVGSIKKTCIICGYSISEVFSHNIKTTVIAPTINEFGYTDYECTLSCEYHARGNITYNLTNLYGYNYFQENYPTLASLYEKIDNAYKSVGTRDIAPSTVNVGGEDTTIYQIGKVSYTGITVESAKMVWSMYKLENPWYYWTENTMLYSSNFGSGELIITIDPNYATYTSRQKVDLLVENYLTTATSTITETNPDKIIKAIHDYICDNMSYAYKNGTTIPETAEWAHSIEGAIRFEKGVCESYAKLFYMLCNLYNIEAIMVIGQGKTEGHAWNYVKLNDKWYAVDCTWDDQSYGIIYKYYLKGSHNFTDHLPGSTNPADEYYQYELPELSLTDYS